MLRVESLCVRAGTFRLQEVGLCVAEGESHAVLGPSGSGKSTLLQAVLGVLPPESGSIMLDGIDTSGVPIERRGLGYVPQLLGLFPHLSVRDNIAYSARARKLPQAQFQPVLDRLVEATGIGSLLDRSPQTLSGGERQRVGIVRALASQPRLVLLDEPFTALDQTMRRELWRLMQELRRQWRLTMLLITHDLAEAYSLADNITVLLDGLVAQQGPKEEVCGRPSTLEVARFLGVETLEPGRVLGASEGLITVEVAGTRLVALERPGVSRNVLVSIRAEDVTLETGVRAAIGIPQNRLPVRVLAVQAGNPMMTVELDAGFSLCASVTRSACEELDLRSGSELTAVIKAPAVHLIPAREGASLTAPHSVSH